uniref:Uncharacterized protein n=1 Tax=Eptatretus burgeri TaxID=7764 RepID=A0A8C4R9W2_EPTBU
MFRMFRMGLLVLVALSLLVTLTLGSGVPIGVPMPGAPVTADVNDPTFKQMVRKAVLNFNGGINDMYLYKLNDIVGYSQTVVISALVQMVVVSSRVRMTVVSRLQLYPDVSGRW